MSQFDRLFDSMAQRNAHRAILISDQPMQLVIGGQTISGAPVMGASLLNMLVEVVPANQQAALYQDGQFDVFYPTPQGTVRINITREGEALRAVLDRMPATSPQASPAQANPFGTSPTAPMAPYPPQPPQPVAPAPMPYGGSPYPVQGGYGDLNSSGSGAMGQVPPELQGRWNWGAFFGTWIWGIVHNTWISLLCFIPCVGIFMPFVLGAKGNEWAWQNKRFASVEEFKRTQMTWGIAGFAIQAVLFLPMLLILSAIVFPVFGRAHSNAQRSSSQSNLKQIGLAVMQFTQDHNETYPTGRTLAEWKTATLPYAKSESLYVSPSTQEPYSVNPSLSGISFAQVDFPATMPMFYEKKQDDLGGHNIGFADGHVKWIPERNWQPYRTYFDSVGGE